MRALRRKRSSPMRSFDPRSVGSLECRAWETYYRRKWIALLIASIGLVRAAFRMSWPRTARGAWLVLRANQKWAPFPDNDPNAARPGSAEALVVALQDLYAYTYGADPAEVRAAAALRAEAMVVSDSWVEAGRDPEDERLAQERALLIRSYAALLAAVHR